MTSLARAAAGLAFGLAAFGATAQLAPLPEPSATERELLGTRFVLKAVQVDGVKSLPAGVVEALVGEYQGREVGAGELRTIAARLTQLYIERGFATSGVVFMSASAGTGTATYAAIEGPVSQVRFVAPPRVASPAWLTRQLVPDAHAPARLDDIQERMAALRDAGVVDRINASLEPLSPRGSSELVVSVEEPRPWSLAIDYDNYHSPVIGAWRPSVAFAHRNLTGWGDRLDARIGRTSGLEDVSFAWLGMLPHTQALAGMRFERSDALAIDPPAFRSLDITTVSQTIGADLGWQFATRASYTVQARVAFDRRRSDTTLLGMPFSFVAGLPDGRARADVWRASVNATQRGEADVAFVRVQASRGLVTSTLEEAVDAPKKNFTSGLLQLQYARRLTESGVQAVARLEGQYTRDRLLPIEKYSLGGHATVRGYRENVVLGDRAALGVAELRVPVWKRDDALRLDCAVFVDAAWADNVASAPGSTATRLASGGVSLIAAGPWGLAARLDVARPSRRWLTDRDNIQDRGVHFGISWSADKLLP